MRLQGDRDWGRWACICARTCSIQAQAASPPNGSVSSPSGILGSCCRLSGGMAAEPGSDFWAALGLRDGLRPPQALKVKLKLRVVLHSAELGGHGRWAWRQVQSSRRRRRCSLLVLTGATSALPGTAAALEVRLDGLGCGSLVPASCARARRVSLGCCVHTTTAESSSSRRAERRHVLSAGAAPMQCWRQLACAGRMVLTSSSGCIRPPASPSEQPGYLNDTAMHGAGCGAAAAGSCRVRLQRGGNTAAARPWTLEGDALTSIVSAAYATHWCGMVICTDN